ncbi:uncharacterized protein CIMG_12341 [Coccidioides immitis RS]|uniref:Uncharacterized protein n=1 Tax=Coccidioides immitis (strain RS) TaxID=246410 RepID=A0A0D8JWR1_COCIM|nr:uncharacterized protein CIMG_12341 [Coccidioides immitis RS]KJF61371.1 hypothetical protein CIMG_12341 [Coccidioides immitis RS]
MRGLPSQEAKEDNGEPTASTLTGYLMTGTMRAYAHIHPSIHPSVEVQVGVGLRSAALGVLMLARLVTRRENILCGKQQNGLRPLAIILEELLVEYRSASTGVFPSQGTVDEGIWYADGTSRTPETARYVIGCPSLPSTSTSRMDVVLCTMDGPSYRHPAMSQAGRRDSPSTRPQQTRSSTAMYDVFPAELVGLLESYHQAGLGEPCGLPWIRQTYRGTLITKFARLTGANRPVQPVQTKGQRALDG